MATIAGSVSLPSPSRVVAKAGSEKVRAVRFPALSRPIEKWPGLVGKFRARPVMATPEKISSKVEESIKSAEEACAGGADAECAAAWDEVEELSAAASHARDKQKQSDPLENYCKDNPETDECRTYDN
ncbi:calvin cycle protein CP12-2, chloroplastic [Cajanus cajan]|uniref:Calvin cycle protein CP12 n=1 Tax=Cajanus cajan TaxID=3821 RepID=A0A151SJT4_CAJCA|nr:calvin cycle protein CP12-2, chloroplastic [Cajanus cajan]KYP55080.1 Calvin cycle protein CP12 [Cajanus cajan]